MFCEKLNIEPQFTLNAKSEDEKIGWQWIEYAVGDTNSLQGKIRSKSGHPNPFNLKYVEIGNENWDDYDAYLPKYIKFYDYIKERNDKIMIIANLNHWDLSTTPKVFNYIKNKVDLISYHPAIFNPNKVSDANDQEIFLSTSGSAESMQYTISYYHKWLEENGYGNRVKQAVTEWWSTYGNLSDWLLDTNSRNSSLESALWNIGILNNYLRNPDDVFLANRTNGIGFIKRGFSKNGKRQIFGSASLWAMSMLSNHHGDSVIFTNTICKIFEAHESKELAGVWGAKRLDVSTTKSKDSIFISIINRHPTDIVSTTIIIDNNEYIGNAYLYSLNSDSYLDRNTPDEPLKVTPFESSIKINKNIELPPHSFNIIAIPFIKSSIDSVDNNQNFTYDNIITNNLHFTIAKNFIETRNLKIFNLLGEEVYSYKLNDSQIEYNINLESLPKGVYFGKINNINFKFLKKVE